MDNQTIIELLTDAATALKDIKGSVGADEVSRQAALETYKDILLLIGRHAVNSYEGRTALLTGLVAELSEFNKTIKHKNPITAQVDELSRIADEAVKLFKSEKKTAASE